VLTLAVLTLLTAIALLLVGLRGRQIDDHPHCRRCGHDLTGRSADSVQCPECGAELVRRRAVRIGQRRRRDGPLWTGWAALVLATIVLSPHVRRMWRSFVWEEHKPEWWLRHDLAGSAANRDAALSELSHRVSVADLSHGTALSVADLALAAQAGTTPWDGAWGGYLESAYAVGQLDRARWVTYARQALRASLVCRPVIRPGDPLSVALLSNDWRAGSGISATVIGSATLYVDGKAVHIDRGDIDSIAWAHINLDNMFDPGWGEPQIPGEATSRLKPGRHTVTASARLYLGSYGEITDAVPAPAPNRVLAELGLPLSAVVQVVDAAHAPAVSVSDPNLKPAILSAIQIHSVQVVGQSGMVSVAVHVANAPARLAFAVAIHPVGMTTPTLTSGQSATAAIDVPPGDTDDFPVSVFGTIDPAVNLVDVTLQPAVEAARAGIDLTPIWGEAITIRNVPVKH
jgi:predicted RNA-binding Zn-ribbon protein involved in translation (DUF1610 family)